MKSSSRTYLISFTKLNEHIVFIIYFVDSSTPRIHLWNSRPSARIQPGSKQPRYFRVNRPVSGIKHGSRQLRYFRVNRPVSRVTTCTRPTLHINYKDSQGLTDLYLGSNTDQDSSDTSGLTDLYLGSQHLPDVTDQLQGNSWLLGPIRVVLRKFIPKN